MYERLQSSPVPAESPVNSVVAERLSPDSLPEHWSGWKNQIDQMIPPEVRLSSFVLYDWKFESDLTVDIYRYDSRNEAISPLARVVHPDLSFSRRMEDAIADLDQTTANTIRDLASNGHKLVGVGPIVVYKNKQIQSPKMFGPTIDTLMMCSVIERQIELTGTDQTALELGTGNGMIAKMMLSKFHSQLGRLFATDLSAVVLNQAARNILSLELEEFHKDKLATVRDPDLFKNLRDQSLHLIVSNPPYIPDFRSAQAGINQAITGLDVYGLVLGPEACRCLHDAGKVLLILSSVSAGYVRDLVQSQDNFVEGRVLAQKLVPFDLLELNTDAPYLQKLEEQNLIFEISGAYYHKVEVVEFQKARTLH